MFTHYPLDNRGPGRPFDKAAVMGCEKLIDNVVERFIEEFGFADCFERKKSQNVSGVSR
jgi:hypothetical protein